MRVHTWLGHENKLQLTLDTLEKVPRYRIRYDVLLSLSLYQAYFGHIRINPSSYIYTDMCIEYFLTGNSN